MERVHKRHVEVYKETEERIEIRQSQTHAKLVARERAIGRQIHRLKERDTYKYRQTDSDRQSEKRTRKHKQKQRQAK